MPWSKKDADSHTQEASDPKLKRMWADVANKILAKTGDDGQAVKEANGVVKKQHAKKSSFDDLLDLAKASRTQGHNAVHFNGVSLNKTRFKKTKFHKTRFNKQANVGKVRSTRAHLKSIDGEDEEKGIGNTLAPAKNLVVRAHKRENLSRQNASKIRPFARRKFEDV